jgi:prophage antirepressor-like protein
MNQSLAVFHGNQLSIIDHAGRKWLTADQVGHCLGYNEANSRKGVNKLYNAHSDEFTEQDTGIAEMATPGGKQQMRIFSGTGCIKLGFFANTPRAKDFRTWASKELDDRQSAPAPTATPLESNMASLAGDMASLARGLKTIVTKMNVTGRYIGLLEVNQKGRNRVTPEVRRKVMVLKGEGMSNSDVGRLLRISPASVSLIFNGKYPDTKVEDDQPSIAERLDAMIEREQAEAVARLEGGDQ